MNFEPSFTKSHQGFTLIELIVFLVVTGLIANVIFISYSNALLKTPDVLENVIARETAKQCMEWFVGQRRLLNYSSITCPSSSIPAFCTTPAGYTLTVNISCTTINTDANYKTIIVTVGGKGNATLTTLVANY